MKKTLLLLILPLLAVTFNSCSKDDDDAGEILRLIKTITYDDGDVLTLTYDNQSRIKTYKWVENGTQASSEYTYEYQDNLPLCLPPQ